MVIKLRKFSTNIVTKVILFLLTVIMITGAITLVQSMMLKETEIESLLHPNFTESAQYENLMLNTMYHLEQQDLEEPYYYYYLLASDDTVKTNVKDTSKSYFEKNFKYYMIYEDQKITMSQVNNKQFTSIYTPNVKTVYFAFTDEYMEKQITTWNEMHNYLENTAINISILLGLSLLLIITLCIVTGRNSTDKELHLNKVDRIYTDIQMLIGLGIMGIWFAIVGSFTSELRTQTLTLNTEQAIALLISCVVTGITTITIGILFLSFARKIKASIFLKHSLVYTVCYKIYDFLKSLFDGRAFAKYPYTKSLFYRQVTFIIASVIQVFFTIVFILAQSFLFMFSILLELVIVYWYIKGNNDTYKDINHGFNESMEEQMKAERMKIDLITNVSHDLKTPLTSIIGYVDLLSKEENLSDSAKDYIQILGEKSERLKKIVEDLFDLAKATSGNIPIEMETLDINKLVEQTLADMEDSISQSGMKVVTKQLDKPIYIKGDGDKLYRVFQNVVDNALKYSLPNTRIFIELKEDGHTVSASIKNIAGYEMDFTAYDIIQRFNRGDKSRSTEGSGLGLAIADSFTTASGGQFKVLVEGDVFQVIIRFPIVTDK